MCRLTLHQTETFHSRNVDNGVDLNRHIAVTSRQQQTSATVHRSGDPGGRQTDGERQSSRQPFRVLAIRVISSHRTLHPNCAHIHTRANRIQCNRQLPIGENPQPDQGRVELHEPAFGEALRSPWLCRLVRRHAHRYLVYRIRKVERRGVVCRSATHRKRDWL